MMLKTGMEVEEDCTIFNYGQPRSKIKVKSKDRTIVAGPEVNPEPKSPPQGKMKGELGTKPPRMC